MTLKIVELDIYSDWIEIIKAELQIQGYPTDNLTVDNLSVLYFALQKRLIPSVPRNILRSDIFNCPSELQNGLTLLEKKIKNGNDLKANLSRKLKDLSDQDGLLFDWGIHHLHLGTLLEADGFVNRTGPLLYARFTNNNAYLIGIISHGAWTTQELIRIIHRNWPDSIESYRLKDVLGVSQKFDDFEIKQLRNAQINTILEIEKGAVYIGPGGGLAASGDSTESVMNHLQNLRQLKQLEKSIRSDTTHFLEGLFKDGLSFITNNELIFKLHKDVRGYYIHEQNNNFQIILGNDVNN